MSKSFLSRILGNSVLLVLFLFFISLQQQQQNFLVDAAPLWTVTTSDTVESGLALNGPYVYFGTAAADGQLRKVNVNTGAVAWSYFPGANSHIASTPAFHNKTNAVIFGVSNGKFPAVNDTSGDALWFQGISGIFGDPIIDGDRIYIGDDFGQYFCFNATNNGSIIWQTNLGSAVRASSDLANGTLVIACINGNVFSLNATTGAQVWNNTHVMSSSSWGHVYISNTIGSLHGRYVVIGAESGDLYCFTLKGGNWLWRYDTGSYRPLRTKPAEVNSTIFIGVADGSLHALEISSGSMKWKFQATSGGNYSFCSSPVAANGQLAFGASDGYVYSINQLGTTLSSPDQKIYIGTGNMSLTAPVLVNKMLIVIHGKSVSAIGDPTIITTTSLPPGSAPSDSPTTGSTFTTGAGGSTVAPAPVPGSAPTTTTQPPWSTWVSNPAVIAGAGKVNFALCFFSLALVMFLSVVSAVLE